MKEKEASVLPEFSNFLLLQVFTECVVAHFATFCKNLYFFEK